MARKAKPTSLRRKAGKKLKALLRRSCACMIGPGNPSARMKAWLFEEFCMRAARPRGPALN